MDLGIKCEPLKAARDDWRRLYGSLADVARAARGAGAAFAEINWDEVLPPDRVLETARPLADAGLWVSVHPYHSGALAPEIFSDAARPGLLRLLETGESVSAISGRDVPMIFHGGRALAEPHHVPFDEAMVRAAHFFSWADAEIANHFPHVRLLAETQLPHLPEERPRIRLGDTWEDCLRLVDGTRARICWDFGHAFQSVELGRHAAEPPPEFLRRVGHVHAHDVILRDGRFHDHQPLGAGIAPWRENLRRLAGVGFEGGVLLEFDLMLLGGPDGLASMLRFARTEADAAWAA